MASLSQLRKRAERLFRSDLLESWVRMASGQSIVPASFARKCLAQVMPVLSWECCCCKTHKVQSEVAFIVPKFEFRGHWQDIRCATPSYKRHSTFRDSCSPFQRLKLWGGIRLGTAAWKLEFGQGLALTTAATRDPGTRCDVCHNDAILTHHNRSRQIYIHMSHVCIIEVQSVEPFLKPLVAGVVVAQQYQSKFSGCKSSNRLLCSYSYT